MPLGGLKLSAEDGNCDEGGGVFRKSTGAVVCATLIILLLYTFLFKAP